MNLLTDVEVIGIEPQDNKTVNISAKEKADLVFVVEYNAQSGNATVIISNTTDNEDWNVFMSGNMFHLPPNSTRVVRTKVSRGENGESENCSVTIKFLFVKNTNSYELYRTYNVRLLSEDEKSGDSQNPGEIDFFGYEIELPGFLNNDIGRFMFVIVLWGLITLVVVLFLDPVVKSLTKKTETEVDDIILEKIRKPVFLIVILYGLIQSMETTSPPDEIVELFSRIYGIIFFSILLFTGYNIFTSGLDYMDKQLEKTSLGSKFHYALVPALSKIGSIIFFFIGLNVILGYLGMDLALLLGGMTIMGLVIAFAAQDTLSNFFGGIFLIMEPNFKEGDTIILQGTTYTVTTIGMRMTKLYDISNHALVIIPNNILANDKILTLTEPDRKVKMNIEVGVAYGTDVDMVEETLLKIAHEHPDISEKEDSPPFVRFTAFGDSSLNFKLVFWVEDLLKRFKVRHEIMKQVNRTFEAKGIEIPFPQRVIYMAKEETGEKEKRDVSETRTETGKPEDKGDVDSSVLGGEEGGGDDGGE